MYSHHILGTTEYISTGSQPTRGQLTGKINVSLSLLAPESWSRETGLAVLSRVSLIIIYTQAESGAYYRARKGLKVVPVTGATFAGHHGCCTVNVLYGVCRRQRQAVLDEAMSRKELPPKMLNLNDNTDIGWHVGHSPR